MIKVDNENTTTLIDDKDPSRKLVIHSGVSPQERDRLIKQFFQGPGFLERIMTRKPRE